MAHARQTTAQMAARFEKTSTSEVLLLQVRHRVKVVTASSDSDWLTRLLAACTESCHTLNPIFLFAAIHWLAGLHHEL